MKPSVKYTLFIIGVVLALLLLINLFWLVFADETFAREFVNKFVVSWKILISAVGGLGVIITVLLKSGVMPRGRTDESTDEGDDVSGTVSQHERLDGTRAVTNEEFLKEKVFTQQMNLKNSEEHEALREMLEEKFGNVMDAISTMESKAAGRMTNVNIKIKDMDEKLERVNDRVSKMTSALTAVSNNVLLADSRDTAIFKTNQHMGKTADNLIGMLPRQLQRFADYKAKRFIDLVVEIIEIGFYKKKMIQQGDAAPTKVQEVITERVFMEKVTDRANEIREEGYKTVGRPFTDKFYENHLVATEIYIEKTKEIITSPGNFKAKRFVEVSEEFLTEFLTSLSSTYQEHGSLLEKGKEN